MTAGFLRVTLGPDLFREVRGRQGAVFGGREFFESLPERQPAYVGTRSTGRLTLRGSFQAFICKFGTRSNGRL